MKQTPAQQWTALSALYEQADDLTAPELQAFLDRLDREKHPLRSQLMRMLEARSHIETDDFLNTLPRLTPLPVPPQNGWQSGSRVGPYRLVRSIGEGGMAEVWLAERDDGAFKRRVAIKLPFPRPGRTTLAIRFDRERDILASLRHPNIAGLFDAGVMPDGQAWLALEYVEGLPIDTFCDERRLNLRERMLLFRQVLLAVQHAHSNLVIHRDLKPGNILVTPQGEARLLDFGIAKLLESQTVAMPETELTQAAGRSMTPRYASPEQLNGRPLTTACDVYSLGVVFYELMCGVGPYELKIESVAWLEQAILDVEPRAPSRRSIDAELAAARSSTPRALARELSPEIDAIALRCLAKSTSARYLSVDAVLADVDRWLNGEAVLARSPSTWYRAVKFAARHRLGVGLGLAAVASLVGVATVAVVMGLQARDESARASASRDFMLSLFKRADQEKARGADITARDLLDTGRRDVRTRLAGEPRLQAELLQGIGNIQEDMGEFAQAEASFGDVAATYRRLGMTRDNVLALLSQSNSSLRMGNAAKAKDLLQEATILWGRSRRDAEVDGRLAAAAGWIANMQDDSARARGLFEEARAAFSEGLGPLHPRTLDAVSGQIFAERQLRHYDVALRLLDQIDAANHAAGASPLARANHAVDRVELLIVAGRFASGLAYATGAVVRCDEELGPHQKLCKRLGVSLSKLQVRLGLLDDAKRGIAAADAYSKDASSMRAQLDALLLMLRLSSISEPLARAGSDPLFDRLSTLAQSRTDVSVGAAYRMRTMLGLAESRLLRGDPAGGQQWLARATALRDAEPAARAPLFEAVTELLGGIATLEAVDDSGGAAKASDRLRAAVARFAAIYGVDHPMTHFFGLNQAVALRQMGRVDEARRIVDAAEPNLREAFGEQSPTFQRILRLRASLAADAVADPPRRQHQPLEFFS